MKGIVIVILVVVIGLLFFSSCSNNQIKSYPSSINVIKGDCFNDSLITELDKKLKRIGFVLSDSNFNNDTIFRIYDKSTLMKIEDNSEYYSHINWNLSFIENKIIAKNKFINEYGLIYSGTNSLEHTKNDTLFWNVINMIREYCYIRDSTYLIDMKIPE